MPEEIKIRIGTEYDPQGVNALKQDLASAAQQGATTGHAPGAVVPGGGADPAITASAAAAMRGPDRRAEYAAKAREMNKRGRDETERLTDDAQEKLNDQLVKEEATRQGQEAKVAVAAERKAKAEQLRAGRAEQRRNATEDHMQEALNESLVKQEEKAQQQRKAVGDRREQYHGNLAALEMRAARPALKRSGSRPSWRGTWRRDGRWSTRPSFKRSTRKPTTWG
jgi:hypothetical protein